MEESVVLKIIIREGELIVEGGGHPSLSPLTLVGLLEKVKNDILTDVQSIHKSPNEPLPSSNTYDA